MKIISALILTLLISITCNGYGGPIGRIIPPKQIQLVFSNDSISIKLSLNIDTFQMKIPYGVEEDKRIVCNSCLCIHDGKNDSFASNYLIGDSILLLPIMDFNRILLFGINFKRKILLYNNILKDIYLATTLDAFFYDSRNNEITIVDFPYLNKSGKKSERLIHIFIVKSTTFNYSITRNYQDFKNSIEGKFKGSSKTN